MRGFAAGLSAGLILGMALALVAGEQFFKGQRVYVKAEQENLRNAPQGDRLGSLAKGTEVFVHEDAGKWVRASVVGFIWKESLTGDKRSTLGTPMRASMILVRTKAQADDLVKQIRGGAKFEEMAREHSIDAGSAARGGDLGEVYPGELSADFESAIKALTPGSVSAPVKTKLGFYIFKRIQ